MNDSTTVIDRLISQTGRLYSLPAVAMKVLELTDNPQVDTRALKACIENDPALTSKILRVVNSSLFGLSREVSDLNQALALLGTKPLKLLVLGFSLPEGLFTGVAAETLQRFWRHTLTRAVAGREISESLWHLPGDDAFIAGLLQDVGMLLLIQQLGDPYVQLLDRVTAAGLDLADLERESMGFDHTMLSARLLAGWSLPPTLVGAIAGQSVCDPTDFSSSPESILAQILHPAELIAELLAEKKAERLGPLLEAIRRTHEFSEAQLQTLVDHLEEKVRQLADILSLQLPEGLDYGDVLAKAHHQLVDVADEAAGDLLRFRRQQAESEEETLLAEIQSLAEAVSDAYHRPVEAGGPPPSVANAASTPNRTTVPRSTKPQAETQAISTIAADAGLVKRLTATVTACRQARCPLSLLLLQLDEANKAIVNQGLGDVLSWRKLLQTLCQTTDHPGAMCVARNNGLYALILPNCDRRTAVELGSQIIKKMRSIAVRRGQQPVGISVGAATVALPPKNFPAADLFESANRCLYGSHASGGSVVKSIEIY